LKKTTSPSANKAFGANLNRDNDGPFWFADKATTFAAVAQNSQSIMVAIWRITIRRQISAR
jgi:hypothetical protein